MSHLSGRQAHLSSQAKTNPKVQMNAIMLGSGKELEGPKMSMTVERKEVEEKDYVKN